MKILICDDDIYFAQCIYKFLQQIESEQNLSWIIHGVAVKVAESHIVTIF